MKSKVNARTFTLGLMELFELYIDIQIKFRVLQIGSVFIIPGIHTKNGEDRLVILNTIARSVVERQRGKHPEFVFVFRGQALSRLMNSAWKRARKKTNLPHVRVHDLKHTFGRRLRSAGVSFEDR
jgi:integrase